MTLCGAGALLAATLTLQAASKDDVAGAIKKLADGGGYSWKATSESPQFNMGPTLGKIDKDGCALVSRTWGDNTVQSVHHGKKLPPRPRTVGAHWRNSKPTRRIIEAGSGLECSAISKLRRLRPGRLLKAAGDLALSDGAYSASLSEAKVKELMTFGGRSGGEGPEIKGAKGSVKFWVENGLLKKYQYAVQGTMNWNNEDREIDRTTTVEISNVGSTKVEVPEAAKAKL